MQVEGEFFERDQSSTLICQGNKTKKRNIHYHSVIGYLQSYEWRVKMNKVLFIKVKKQRYTPGLWEPKEKFVNYYSF